MNTATSNTLPNPELQRPAPRTSLRGATGAGVAAAALLVGVLGVGSAFVHLSGAVVAPGVIATQGRPQAVQHLDGGIVREILVRNGSTVQQGQLLMRLDDTQLRANVEILRNRLREGLARRARLQAERDRAAAIDWALPADVAGLGSAAELAIAPEQRAAQQRLFDIRRAARSGQVSVRGEKVKQFESQGQGIQGLIASKTEQIRSLEGELAKLRDLQKDGFVSETRILTLERELAALVGQVNEHRAELGRLGSGIDETRIGNLQGEREFQESVLSELRQVTAEFNDTAQQFRATREQLARVEIRAPQPGLVHELSVYTVGGVIHPGATVMQVVSQRQGLQVDANVEPQFIDQLALQQGATVHFPAFSRDAVPEVLGSVRTISPTSVVDERSGASFYRIEVQIDPAELARLNGRSVVPGMPVEVFISTGERSVLSYLLKPVADQFKRALREK